MKKILCQGLAVMTLASAGDARAADSTALWRTKAPAKAPPARAISPSAWTGFYVGGQAGVSTGRSAWSATQPGGADFSGSLDFFRPYDVFNGHGSHFAGFTGGYNYGNLPKCFLGISRANSSMSASTMMRTSSLNRTFGSQPRISFAFAELPMSKSTSAGRS